MSSVKLNLTGLDSFLKALQKSPSLRVGILNSSPRKDGKATNATVGAIHEFGTSKVPQRSFLRVPLAEHLSQNLESSGLFNKDTLAQVVKRKSLKPWVEKIETIAKDIVLNAFDSNGYGKWPSDKSKTLEHKKVKQTLRETGQLKNSISTEIVEGT